MDESSESSKTSPKPLAFTIDFNSPKNVDTQRQKVLAEKLQKRHKRGQSLSKLDNCSAAQQQHHTLSGNAPRKSSFQSEGYYSSDEKQDKSKSSKDMTLWLQHVSNNMTRSLTGENLETIKSPKEFELKHSSSSSFELDMFSFRTKNPGESTYKHHLSQEYEKLHIEDNNEKDVFVEGTEFDFDKSDTVSDAGTYTLDADNYSEDQKARMSIDRDFNIEHVSVQKKTEEYIESLSKPAYKQIKTDMEKIDPPKDLDILTHSSRRRKEHLNLLKQVKKASSPIMSPTENFSVTQDIEKCQNVGNSDFNQTFTKTSTPSSNEKCTEVDKSHDQGSIISVTSSGAFKAKCHKKPNFNLTKSEVQVQAYIDNKACSNNSNIKESVKVTQS
ncbi:unnamed protein product [Acanthoscelides obtectus]|uniref:Uncharacterized protein n=1 Tax=Acanthoscelides obtectus TaxID=200917 RepID=A0A9P0PHR6_ACAOB|nr:unnamed protein product [Acanthoscelides obtectus]CAK1681373.1 hypothetical protein AOBTE_LOCUS33118 [Acanthoscelides obtectus]